jgi:threonine/homoserine/homoserine lactone efflux protein
MLPSTNPALDDDDEANAAWKLVCIGTVLLFLSWIVQSWLGARKGKIARLKFEPNASRLMR